MPAPRTALRHQPDERHCDRRRAKPAIGATSSGEGRYPTTASSTAWDAHVPERGTRRASERSLPRAFSPAVPATMSSSGQVSGLEVLVHQLFAGVGRPSRPCAHARPRPALAARKGSRAHRSASPGWTRPSRSPAFSRDRSHPRTPPRRRSEAGSERRWRSDDPAPGPPHAHEVCAGTIHLVDEHQPRNTVLVRLAARTVSVWDCTPPTAHTTAHAPSRHTETALHLDSEINVPRRIDDVDAVLGELPVPIPFQKHVVAADVIVMPRSRSCSIQSITDAPSCTSPIRRDTPE